MNRNIKLIIAELDILAKYYDAWRVVDPNNNTIISGSHDGQSFPEESCYSKWQREAPCTNCISFRALTENQTFRKVEYIGNQLYFIKAVPVEVNEERYVLELVQNITDSSIIDSVLSSIPTMEEMTHKIERLNDIVIRDALTGIYNRRYIMEKLPVEIMSARLENSVFTVGMLDIDHFKKINDQYGHVVGDEVLKFLAGTLTSKLRTSDWVARYGGEEFLLFIRGANAEAAYQVAEKLRQLIEKLEFNTTTVGPIHITASFGLHQVNTSEINIDQIINQADNNLYEAKRLGRNRVVVT